MTRRFDDLRHVRPLDRNWVDALLAGIAFAIGALAFIGTVYFWMGARPAHARWTGTVSDPATAAWFKNQHNANGQWCCDESDGHPFFGDYKINDDGSVTIHHDGIVHDLPAYMVLKGSNPTGHAVWWFTEAGEDHRDYCFAPGSLS